MALRPTTKLKKPFMGFLPLIILSSLISSSQGGVIKKRELDFKSTTETSLKDHFRANLSEIQPTILTAINTKSDVVTTKLQLVPGKSFVTESSKELTNNEILINEAKKLLEEEDKIIKTNQEAEIKQEEREEKEEEEIKTEGGEKTNDSLAKPQNQSPDNLQDIKQIIMNLENKEQQLSESSKTSQEMGTNDIKEEKLEKLKDSLDVKDMEEPENSRSLENSLKPNEEKPRPPSKILTELRKETDEDNKEPKLKETQVENSIDSIKLNSEEKSNKDTSIEIITLKPETSSLAPKKEDLQEKELEKQEHEKESLEIKTPEPKTLEKDLRTTNSFLSQENNKANEPETSTSRNSNTDKMELKETTTLKPVEEQIKDKLDSKENLLLENKPNNKIPALMEQKDPFKLEKPSPDTTLQPQTKESDLLVFEGDKKEHARSMFTADSTTLTSLATNEILMPITTYRPIILSVKEENLKEEGEINEKHAFSPKEKKPKFINDNSTNAQQLNLPNNPEVWSLAAMKSLPKANVSLETTTHEQNQTLAEDFKENLVNNSSKELQMKVKANSEKNLLDWSQIMRDKELATSTTRNEGEVKERKEMGEELTTLRPGGIEEKEKPELRAAGEERGEEEKQDLHSSSTLATILSLAANNNNISETDKKLTENINNNEMVEMITRNLDVAITTTTTEASKLVNNPFNATVNIEPILNEINLTLNHSPQTAKASEEKMHTTEKQVTGTMEDTVTSTSTPTLTQTETEATAVDMTKLEQISNETTTVSTLETSKPNVSLFSTTNSIQNENSSEINVNLEKSNSEQINNQYNEKDLNTNSLAAETTTTVLPITTFRPSILAITSTTSTLPVTFEQEIKLDQNGNEETNKQINLIDPQQQPQQKQSIIIQTTTSEPYNSMNTSETHLSEREFETTTTTTTTTTTEIPTTTPLTELNASKTVAENILTSLEEIQSSTTSAPKTTTSFTTENVINSETTERILEVKEETKTTTPKQGDEEVEVTTIGSAVVSEENIETKENKEEDIIEVTTTLPEIIITTTTTTTTTSEATQTPVVVYESSTKPTATTTSSPITITTIRTSEANKTETEDVSLVTTQETEHKEKEEEAKEEAKEEENAKLETTTMTTQTTSEMPATVIKDEETYISLLDDTTTTTTQLYTPAISTTATPDFTSSPPTFSPATTPAASPSTTTTTTTMPSSITTKIEEIYNVIHSTTTELIQTTTTQLITEIVEESSTSTSSPSTTISFSTTEEITPLPTNIINTADIGKTLPTLTSIMGGNSGNMYPKNADNSGETDVNVIIAITVSVIGVIALILLVGFLYLMRKRQKQNSYPNRCRPVSMDEFTIDNASVGGSMRKSSALRSSKRTYGNLAFDDPSLRHNPMGVHELAKFVQERLRIFEEFRDVPQITSRLDEVPAGCEDKNRYANVLPLPETRVILQRLNDDDKTEYINANYVTGPKDPPNYYIACQAPLESTVEDFWRMIWEQQSRVIIQATDLIENGVEKCAEYLPPSVTLDNHSNFGDFQITLQNREVKDKYAISTLLLKNVNENASRELTHYWYKWPEVGVPSEEAPIIAMLLEARSSLISYAIEQANEDKEKSSMATLKSAEEGTAGTVNGGGASPTTNNSNGSSANGSSGEINGNISMVHIKKTARNQGPLTVHCSPGTGRTGTIIACDIAIRSLETPKRTVDIPQIVYYVRRGRASAVLTKEQYEFIYKVANMYAAKISNPTNYN